MLYQVEGTVTAVRTGVGKTGEQAGKPYYRLELAELGATHDVSVNASDYASVKVGQTVKLVGELSQQGVARGQYSNKMYNLGPGRLPATKQTA